MSADQIEIYPEPFIRTAGLVDIPALVEIIRKSFQQVADRFNLTAKNCPKHPSNCTITWVEQAFSKNITYYLLELNGKPCGCVALEDTGDTYYLERLAVLPEHQAQGFGKRLVEHCFEKVLEKGGNRIEIGIIREQRDLYEWYQHRGFSLIRHATFDHLPFDVTFMGINLKTE